MFVTVPESIRVLIADDSPTQRAHLRHIIETATDMVVVGEARNGEEVLRMVEELRPMVVSMDVRMPVLDGLEATRRIMAQVPTPVVVVSGALDEDVALSLRALEAGALAVVAKPPAKGHAHFAQRQQELITTLRAMAGVRVIARREQFMAPQVALRPTKPLVMPPEVVAMGASTGGPSALFRLLSALPRLRVPILIVQHLPQEFMGGLVRWLASASPFDVQIARQGLVLKGGMVVLAHGDAHLSVARQGGDLVARLLSPEEASPSRYLPSVDVLFEGVAQVCGSAAVGILLTGMGDDGAQGMHRLQTVGARTLAQDAASCTVFGMPNAAIERGGVDKVVSLTDLPTELLKLL
jgi:two-component system chemotaxis response regulator CheB